MKLKEMLPYLIINAIAFYLMPLMIQDTGTAMGIMLIALPLICLITALIYGVKHSFSVVYAIIIAILFAPTILIYYNSTAYVYIVGYGIIALVGNIIGKIFHKAVK